MDEIPLEALIPHAPPARLVERVLAADGAGARAELTVREPWTRSGALAPEALVEALAQTAAVYAGVQGAGGPPRRGVLASVSRFEFPSRALLGEVVTLEVRVEKVLGELAAFEGVASVAGREVARGELRVALVAP